MDAKVRIGMVLSGVARAEKVGVAIHQNKHSLYRVPRPVTVLKIYEMNKPDLIYILAPSYSGSTLLTFLLSKHAQIATVGELKATKLDDVASYCCSCGEKILECGFWQAVALNCRNKGIEFSVENFDTELHANSKLADMVVGAAVSGHVFEHVRRAALYCFPGARKALEDSIRRNFEIGQIVRGLQGKDVFLDGSKSPARLLNFLRSGLWNVKVIDLQRDGRGVSYSNKKHLNCTMADAVTRWLLITKEINQMREYLDPNSYTTITYEELCKEPGNTLRRITDKLGLPALHFDGGKLMEGDHHILGNKMRLNSMSDIRFDEHWRMELSKSELREFEIMAGDKNAELGYQ